MNARARGLGGLGWAALAILVLADGLLVGEERRHPHQPHKTRDQAAAGAGHRVVVQRRSGVAECEQLGEVIGGLVACHGVA